MQTSKQPTQRGQTGFTLVEIAIVLVIIGLLIGAILKGIEMINSAKVRRLAELSSGVQSAYAGFIDRYRRVPGDWNAAAAATAIGGVINGGGNNNGRIDNPPAIGFNVAREYLSIGCERGNSRLLVRSHETRILNDICAENRDKFTFLRH